MHPEKFMSLSFKQQQTLALAKYMRDHMERFHGVPHDYLPQERMPEFNATVRYAIYDFFVEDAESDDPFDHEWVEHFAGIMLNAAREFWERYIPNDEKGAFYFTIQDTIVEFLDEFPDGLSDDALNRFAWSIPVYWEIPARDPMPAFTDPSASTPDGRTIG